MSCPGCGTVAADGSTFCEHCGTRLVAPAPEPVEATTPADEPSVPVCRACGGTIAADGYCEQCGEPAANERDHWSERPSAVVGGVCDRGRRHSRNEDAMALGVVGSTAVLVVCDGVSTVPDSDLASLAAARAARDVLATAEPQTVSSWSALLITAAAAADKIGRAHV